MNETIIKSTTVTELKALVKEIEELQDCSIAFGLLYEQEVKLANLQKRVLTIIKKL